MNLIKIIIKIKIRNKKFVFLFSYYRSAHALILVYDISCQPTFDCLPDWLREIQEYANSKVLKILVGTLITRKMYLFVYVHQSNNFE